MKTLFRTLLVLSVLLFVLSVVAGVRYFGMEVSIDNIAQFNSRFYTFAGLCAMAFTTALGALFFSASSRQEGRQQESRCVGA